MQCLEEEAIELSIPNYWGKPTILMVGASQDRVSVIVEMYPSGRVQVLGNICSLQQWALSCCNRGAAAGSAAGSREVRASSSSCPQHFMGLAVPQELLRPLPMENFVSVGVFCLKGTAALAPKQRPAMLPAHEL